MPFTALNALTLHYRHVSDKDVGLCLMTLHAKLFSGTQALLRVAQCTSPAWSITVDQEAFTSCCQYLTATLLNYSPL